MRAAAALARFANRAADAAESACRDGALNPEPLLRFLHGQGIQQILIGGVAVAAHGYRRPSNDLHIVPAPDRENLSRLAETLRTRGRPN